nr:4a-hydroxytetrahydrobiopterin dehydratase [Sneathiella glossodoripedis]
MTKLQDQEIAEGIEKLYGWKKSEAKNAIFKRFKFKDFNQAFAS